MDARTGIELLLTPGITAQEWARVEDGFRAPEPGSRVEVARVLARTVPRASAAEVDAQERALARAGACLVFRWEAAYPAALRDLAAAPPALFVRGRLPDDAMPRVAIVGTRKPSVAGSAFAHRLAKTLAQLGVVVVSGLARGIDTAAHRGALDAGVPTVAVLGTGVDVVYPPENAALMDRIIASGAVVSEQVCGMRAYPGVFPRRNRIISGMSDAVVVVEGSVRSGALITARWALDQGREVGAVPGFPGDFRSTGPNRLLREGAFVVEDAFDVVGNVKRVAERVAHAAREGQSGDDAGERGLDGDAARVYDEVGHASRVDEIALAAGVSVEHAQCVLTMLEIEGRIQRDEAGNYTRPGARTRP